MQFSFRLTHAVPHRAACCGILWGGDSYYDLWLALDAESVAHVNGPSDAAADIAISLEAGRSYRFYIFGQPGPGTITGFNGLNLFFDGNNTEAGISAFGRTNTFSFLPNGNSTFTLQGFPVAGSHSVSYSSRGVIVMLSEYNWNVPAAPRGDVCQAFSFSPGDGDDYFGSFSLRAFPSATLDANPTSGSPGTRTTLSGSGFGSTETINIYDDHLGSPLLGATTADANGSFSANVVVPQHADGSSGFYALGLSSGRVGFVAFAVSPSLRSVPEVVQAGGMTAVEGVGFGAGEGVDIYLDEPRQLLGTVTSNELGSFVGASAPTVTIPANVTRGLNALIGIGQGTQAIGIGKIVVQ